MKTILIVAVIVILICIIFGDGLHIMNDTHTNLLPKADACKPSKPTDASDYDSTKFGKYNKPRR